jgi:hypothetical protein
VSSPAIPWQQLLTVEILQLHTLMPLPAGDHLSTKLMLQTVLVITSRHRPCIRHPVSIVVIQLLHLPSNRNMLTAQKRPWCGPHRKHSCSVVACVYVVHITWQRLLFTESRLNNGLYSTIYYKAIDILLVLLLFVLGNCVRNSVYHIVFMIIFLISHEICA